MGSSVNAGRLTVPGGPDVLARFLDALAAKLSRALDKAAPAIQTRLGLVAAAAVQAAPEYESLLSGELRGQLGVVDAAPVVARVVRNIAAGARVTSLGVRRQGLGLAGGLRIGFLKGDYSDVLSADGAEFVSEGGYTVPWLRWLTLAGDEVLVADHHFEAGHQGRSRTGQGIMLKAGTWRVPPEFAGTAEDNWILRAMTGIGPDLARAIEDELRKAV